MTSTSKTIIFFGSGPVAAESLRRLRAYCHIEAVITKPRPEHHRGSVPVLDYCQKENIPVFTPANKQSLSQLVAQQAFTSSVGVVIDYGIIVEQSVIDAFPLGIINSHFSLLPEWRGADPITFSILSGQKRTGVSLMLIVAAMDEGPLLAQAPFDIPATITTPQLTEALIDLSDGLLQTVLPEYLAGNVEPAPQEAVSIAESRTPSYSRKLTKDDGLLDFSKPAVQLEREIRAFVEWPKSRTQLGAVEAVITAAHVIADRSQALTPGQLEIMSQELRIGTSDGQLAIDRLKPAGKPEMTVQAFLVGYRDRLQA